MAHDDIHERLERIEAQLATLNRRLDAVADVDARELIAKFEAAAEAHTESSGIGCIGAFLAALVAFLLGTWAVHWYTTGVRWPPLGSPPTPPVQTVPATRVPTPAVSPQAAPEPG